MYFDGIGPKDFFKAIAANARKGEVASREGIKNQSPLNRLNNNSKYSSADGFTSNRNLGESLAGQVRAHHLPKGFDKVHSANSARGQRVLKDLISAKNPVDLGLSIHDAKDVTLATNSKEGHDAFANLFKADAKRSDTNYSLGA